MSDIKKGALVKAWDDGRDAFIIGRYISMDGDGQHLVRAATHLWADNVIEIPADLANQLEDLGK